MRVGDDNGGNATTSAAKGTNPPTTPLRSNIPSPTVQATYFGTGMLAGATASLIEAGWSHSPLKSPTGFIRQWVSLRGPVIGRAGVRFWMFDQTKHQLSTDTFSALPVWLKGGLAGGTGGIAEMLAHSLVQLKAPKALPVLAQASRTFLGFSSFTYQWSLMTDNGQVDATSPPRPFVRCWGIAIIAGAVASAVVGRIEGTRRTALWANAVPKGALVTGTTIAVQVTSCAEILRWANA